MKFYREIAVFVILVTLFLSMTGSVMALGISPGKVDYNFEPGAKKTFTFQIKADESHRYMNHSIALADKGLLCFLNNETYEEDKELWYPSFEITPKYLYLKGGEVGKATFTFTMPDKFTVPGVHKALIVVTEMPPRSHHQISAKAAVAFMINLYVPYPGKYLDLEFKAKPAQPGKVVEITISAINRGKEDIENAQATAKIYDYEGNLVTTLQSDAIPIKAGEKQYLWIDWQTSPDLKSGVYKAEVDVAYDGNHRQITGQILVGSKDIQLLNYTRTLIQGQINPFLIEFQSLWNDRVPVYAEIEITRDGKTVAKTTSPPKILIPWEKAILTSYIQVPGGLEGDYDGKITAFYDNTPHEYPIHIKIMNKKAPIQEQPEPKPEQKHKSSFSSTSIIIGVCVFLLILGQIIFFIFIRRRDDDDDDEDDYEDF